MVAPQVQQRQHEPSPQSVSNAWTDAQEDINRAARKLKLDSSEFTEQVAGKLKMDLENPVAIRRGIRGSADILESGRMKTQFETGSSGGAFAPDMRLRAERNGLGMPMDVPLQERPVYGYVDVPGGTAHRSYGAVEFQLDEAVKQRTTYTLGDSLRQFDNGLMVGAPIDAPGDIAAWDKQSEYYHKYGVGEGVSYIEAQIQGGVTLADVKRIIIHSASPEYESIIQAATRRGIEVVIDAHGY